MLTCSTISISQKLANWIEISSHEAGCFCHTDSLSLHGVTLFVDRTLTYYFSRYPFYSAHLIQGSPNAVDRNASGCPYVIKHYRPWHNIRSYLKTRTSSCFSSVHFCIDLSCRGDVCGRGVCDFPAACIAPSVIYFRRILPISRLYLQRVRILPTALFHLMATASTNITLIFN